MARRPRPERDRVTIPENRGPVPPEQEVPQPHAVPFPGTPAPGSPSPAIAHNPLPFQGSPGGSRFIGTPSNPTLTAGRRQYTGRRLVVLNPDGVAEGRTLLQSKAGLKLHAADHKAVAIAAYPQGGSALPIDEGLLFESLGVAVVNAAPDKAGVIAALAGQEDAFNSVEWERFVYASAIDPAFLLGYRAGVDRLVEQLLAGQETGTGVAAVVSQEPGRFVDDARFTWGLKATRADNSRFTGKGVSVAVLDTGLDLAHPDFIGRVAGSASFVEGQQVQDGNGHGTHCCGIACGPATPARLPRYGVAPEARLFVGKVLDDSGVGTDTSILGGIAWALEQECDVISMSLGSPVAPGQPVSPAFEQVGNRTLDAGSIIVAAAGNDSRRPGQLAPVNHPANCRSIAAVAAIDAQLNVGWFSNAGLVANGGQIDIAAPGVECLSSWSLPVGYKVESGTSMATPHVAGIAALFADANPGIRGRALLNLLYQHAQRLQAASRDVGAGLVQAL
jgi:subtilisin